jgi:hypothetical protein
MCWYYPAKQPAPKPVEANHILANNESVKWSSKPIAQISQRSNNGTIIFEVVAG